MRTDVSTTLADEYSSPDRKRGARLVLAESGFRAVALGVHERFTPAFAIFLGASAFHIGILTAVTHLFLAISQFAGVRLIRTLGGRRRTLAVTALVSAMPFVLIALVPLAPGQVRVWALIVVAGLAAALTLIGAPAWGSLVSDLVPKSRLGRYLGLKSTIMTAVVMSMGPAGALLLDGLGSMVVWGFVAVYGFAVAARLVSAFLFTRIVDPQPDLAIDAGGTPWRLLRGIRKTTLGRYNVFILALHVFMAMGGPFVAVYLLSGLGISYMVFMMLAGVSSLTTILSNVLWGRLADRKGTKLVLVISTGLMALNPLLWIVSSQMWYLFLIFGIFGVGAAGWQISAYSFVLENSKDEERPAAVGAFAAMASLGVVAGALIGGAIASHMPTIFGHPLLTLFLLSSLLRVVAAVTLLPGALGQRSLPDHAGSLMHAGIARAATLRHGMAALMHAIPH